MLEQLGKSVLVELIEGSIYGLCQCCRLLVWFGLDQSGDVLSEGQVLPTWVLKVYVLGYDSVNINILHSHPSLSLSVFCSLVEIFADMLLEAPQDGLVDHIWPFTKRLHVFLVRRL